MKTFDLRLWSIILLAVVAASLLHGFIDRDHLRLEHRPAGLSLNRQHSVERDACLCFSHGLFIPAFYSPAAHGRSLEAPLFLPAEDPLTMVRGKIFHPPLA